MKALKVSDNSYIIVTDIDTYENVVNLNTLINGEYGSYGFQHVPELKTWIRSLSTNNEIALIFFGNKSIEYLHTQEEFSTFEIVEI